MGTKRKIYNYDSVEIGELELPNETSEEVWQEKLSVYSQEQVDGIPDVTPRQIRQALLLSGITLSQIDDALGDLPEPIKSFAIVEWEYSVLFQRNRPLVESVRALLGWTAQQTDDLWRLAASL